MSDDVRDFLDESSGSRYPAFKFDAVGAGIKGKIIEKPRVVETPALNPPHGPEKKLVVALQPEGGEPQSVWIRKGFLAQAVSDALTTAGAPGLEIGGELAIQHHDTKDTGKVQPAKLFKARYTAPAAGSSVSVDDIFD